MRVLRRRVRYVHPIEDVWAALTDPRAIAEWLMPTTFEAPVPGHRFRFQYDPEPLCPSGVVECEVLLAEPPNLMVWSWRHPPMKFGRPAPPPMRVEWRLTAVAGGTELELVQTGLEGQPWMVPFAMGFGWRLYFRRFLPKVLKHVSDGRFTPGAIPLAQRAYRATNLPAEVVV
jgi:uncharacterized protein YndB with AHSA1/START domain